MNADVITNPESRCKCIMVFHAYLTLFLPSPLSSDLQCLHIPLQQPQSNTSPMTDNGFQKAEHLLYAIFAPYFLVQLCIGESAGGNRPYKHKDWSSSLKMSGIRLLGSSRPVHTEKPVNAS